MYVPTYCRSSLLQSNLQLGGQMAMLRYVVQSNVYCIHCSHYPDGTLMLKEQRSPKFKFNYVI